MKVLTRGPVFADESFAGHEQVVFCHDKDTGLRAIIAIHDTTLGAGHGGTRMWAYGSEADALTDALRLAEGMTYKNAMAHLKAGGAKGVIIGDPNRDKTPELMRAYARFVDRLGGFFVTAEDVGMTMADMDIMADVTKHVRGTTGAGVGDPAPYTAVGVYSGIKAAVRYKLGRDGLDGIRVCIQGLGKVGSSLASLLHNSGAKLWVSDINENAVAKAKRELSAEIVNVKDAHAADVDVFSPCALGAVLDDTTIPDIKASIIAGSANNQLKTDADGERLTARDILYVPDYVVNAGGIIALVRTDLGADDLNKELIRIGDTCEEIFERAAAEGRATSTTADDIAKELIAAARA